MNTTSDTTSAANRHIPRALFLALICYTGASLIHFIHNAEFLGDYPNLPASWTRAGVYLAWVGMTCVGGLGWLLLRKGYQRLGLFFIGVYAMLGLDSLAHYVVAPFSMHTVAMHVTILFEVTTAGVLLSLALWTLLRRTYLPGVS